MNEPTPAQIEIARRLFAHEAAAHGEAAMAADVAARVYDKLLAHVGPLIGDAGVRMLLQRSARNAAGGHPSLAPSGRVDGAAKLRECLVSVPPEAAAAAAVALFVSFFALLATFIGERLTFQVLRGAWPTVIDSKAVTEPGK